MNMEDDEYIRAVIDRFSPDELCDILDISTTDFVDKFYDEVCESIELREILGLEEADD